MSRGINLIGTVQINVPDVSTAPAADISHVISKWKERKVRHKIPQIYTNCATQISHPHCNSIPSHESGRQRKSFRSDLVLFAVPSPVARILSAVKRNRIFQGGCDVKMVAYLTEEA
jgi:hypothetical protein